MHRRMHAYKALAFATTSIRAHKRAYFGYSRSKSIAKQMGALVALYPLDVLSADDGLVQIFIRCAVCVCACLRACVLGAQVTSGRA